MKRKIVKYFREADLFWAQIISLLGLIVLVAVLWPEPKGIDWESKKIFLAGIGVYFLFTLNGRLWSFKRRCLFDPKLNTIEINSIEEMRPYVNRIFRVLDDMPNSQHSLYLHCEEFGSEEEIFIRFYPSEIDYFEWIDRMNILGAQKLHAISFHEEFKGGSMSYKFWTLNSKEVYIFRAKTDKVPVVVTVH